VRGSTHPMPPVDPLQACGTPRSPRSPRLSSVGGLSRSASGTVGSKSNLRPHRCPWRGVAEARSRCRGNTATTLTDELVRDTIERTRRRSLSTRAWYRAKFSRLEVGQDLVKQRGVEVLRNDHPPAIRAKRSRARRGDPRQPRDRMPGPGDDDIIASGHLLEQPGQGRFGLMDVSMYDPGTGEVAPRCRSRPLTPLAPSIGAILRRADHDEFPIPNP
jgi:hypothetical protein